MQNLIVDLSRLTQFALNRDEEGQGMIEYGLLVALISIAAIVVITLIGPHLITTFQDVVNAL